MKPIKNLSDYIETYGRPMYSCYLREVKEDWLKIYDEWLMEFDGSERDSSCPKWASLCSLIEQNAGFIFVEYDQKDFHGQSLFFEIIYSNFLLPEKIFKEIRSSFDAFYSIRIRGV